MVDFQQATFDDSGCWRFLKISEIDSSNSRTYSGENYYNSHVISNYDTSKFIGTINEIWILF